MNVNPNLTRRTFLSWWMASLMTATVVAIVAPILVYVWAPPISGQKRGQLKVAPPTKPNDLKQGAGVRFDAPANSYFLMKDGGGDNSPGEPAYSAYMVRDSADQVHVFAVNCSHLGCSVQLNSDAMRFDCPCHGSQFNLNGTVKHPPATASLSNLDWKDNGDGTLSIVGMQATGGAA